MQKQGTQTITLCHTRQAKGRKLRTNITLNQVRRQRANEIPGHSVQRVKTFTCHNSKWALQRLLYVDPFRLCIYIYIHTQLNK